MIPLAVFGDPIAHSLSPKLHALFAAQANLHIDYRAILAPPETFAQQVSDFFASGGVGANITLPHKAQALKLATVVQPRARLAGAANTLSVLRGSGTPVLVADNTDGEGLVKDLRRQFGELSGMRILVLGAGGAVRGALGPLAATGCAELAVYNRTLATAQAVVQDLQQGMAVAAGKVRAITETDVARFDLVINGISAGHQGRFPLAPPDSWLQTIKFAYDMSYGAAAKPFFSFIQQRYQQRHRQYDQQHNQSRIQQHNAGLRLADGLGMLVEQGALSFAIWTGQKVDAEGALISMRQALSASA